MAIKMPGYQPAGAQPAPGAALATNPAYLAFLRALGAEESEAATSTQTRVDSLNRELEAQLPFLTIEHERGRERISGDFETRGLFRSGQHEVDLGRSRADEAREVGYLRGNVADQVATLRAELARRRADIARRRSEAALDAARDVYVDQEF